MKNTIGMTIETKVDLEVPNLPNWIKGTNPGGTVVKEWNFSIADLSDEQLKSVGIAWTEALIKLARAKREEPAEATRD